MHFIKYIIIGIANTLIHWSTFFLLLNFFNSLGICNLIAFCTAVTLSFFFNTKFNFKVQINFKKYIYYFISMGFINFFIGWCSEMINLLPILTLIISSTISLITGFIFAQWILKRP